LNVADTACMIGMLLMLGLSLPIPKSTSMEEQNNDVVNPLLGGIYCVAIFFLIFLMLMYAVETVNETVFMTKRRRRHQVADFMELVNDLCKFCDHSQHKTEKKEGEEEGAPKRKNDDSARGCFNRLMKDKEKKDAVVGFMALACDAYHFTDIKVNTGSSSVTPRLSFQKNMRSHSRTSGKSEPGGGQVYKQ